MNVFRVCSGDVRAEVAVVLFAWVICCVVCGPAGVPGTAPDP